MRFTEMNTMETVLIDRFVAGGMSPAAAADHVHQLFAQFKTAKPDGYVMFYGDSFACNDDPPSERLVSQLENIGVTVNIVPLG